VNLKEINAFALPGGPMFVHRGMFDAAKAEGEVVGVMAHELAHVKHRDTLTMTVAATISGAGRYLKEVSGGRVRVIGVDVNQATVDTINSGGVQRRPLSPSPNRWKRETSFSS